MPISWILDSHYLFPSQTKHQKNKKKNKKNVILKHASNIQNKIKIKTQKRNKECRQYKIQKNQMSLHLVLVLVLRNKRINLRGFWKGKKSKNKKPKRPLNAPSNPYLFNTFSIDKQKNKIYIQLIQKLSICFVYTLTQTRSDQIRHILTYDIVIIIVSILKKKIAKHQKNIKKTIEKKIKIQPINDSTQK